MTDKPKFFWSPPDGAPIVGITTYEGFVVIATASGVYTIQNGPLAIPLDTWTIEKISLCGLRSLLSRNETRPREGPLLLGLPD
jgi:hypothetical protein